MRRLAAILLVLSLALAACGKKNPNTDPPPPFDPKPASHHKFDGGASDPHTKADASEEGSGGEGE